MNLLGVANFFAILSLAAGAGSVVVIGVRLAAGAAAGPRRVLNSLKEIVGPYTLWLAWLVAATAMAGSLYFSEVAGFIPCALCWYQRIAMYPLAVMLLIGALRRDQGVRPYATALAGVGAIIAAYHVLLQRLPGLPSGTCSLEAPCTAIQVERFGFVTIPVMALIGFVAILVLMWIVAAPDEEAA